MAATRKLRRLRLCDQHGESSCGEAGVVNYCSNSRGIEYCRTNPDGSVAAPCAETWQACP